jgi:hypothetical protein
MSEEIQRTLHERLERQSKHGTGDDWVAGYVSAMSEALHLIVRADGVNYTGCRTFNLRHVTSDDLTGILPIDLPDDVNSVGMVRRLRGEES